MTREVSGGGTIEVKDAGEGMISIETRDVGTSAVLGMLKLPSTEVQKLKATLPDDLGNLGEPQDIVTVAYEPMNVQGEGTIHMIEIAQGADIIVLSASQARHLIKALQVIIPVVERAS